MKDYSKYLTNRNVALLGTISFHALVLAIFAHLNLVDTSKEQTTELLINFVEEDLEEEVIEETEEDTESNVNILDEFSRPLSNQASSRSNENTVEDLRASMKSLDNARDNNDVDLFSDDAEKREIPLKHYESENDDTEEIERKEENAFTGQSTINYFLEGRYSEVLRNPVYTCISGGTIHINIEVNQKGQVVEAKYNKSKSNSKNECLIETALKYARMSRFNTNFNASESQKGYISYQFHKN